MKYVFMTWIIPARKLLVMSQVAHLENTPKRFSKKFCIKSSLFCDFFGLETCKDDSYMLKENLFIKKIP